MAQSSIEWTEKTWNPTTGCTKISRGCKHCYAEIMHRRLQAMGQEKYAAPFKKVVCHPAELLRPYTWKKPAMIFVNSMSDIFHKDVPTDFILQIFKTMNENPHLTFQVLTKRAERLLELNPLLNWTPNIWMGVSVENMKVAARTEYLKQTGAFIKFLSCEPLLGSLNIMSFEGLDWVIVGGESGPGAEKMEEEWAQEIQFWCAYYKVAFFFKQWGGVNKKAAGRLLNGREYNAMPEKYLNQIAA